MPLVGCYKKDDELYLFASLCRRYGDYILDVDNCMDYPIHKFKNCVIGFSGPITLLYSILNQYDFNDIPEGFDLGYLVRNLYPFYLNFCGSDDKNAVIKDDYLCTSEFQLLILGNKHCYVLNPSDIFEVISLETVGVDGAIHYLHDYLDKMQPLEFLKLGFSKTVKYSNNANYPFLLVSDKDLDSLLEMDRKGNVSISDLSEEWRNSHA